MAQNSTDVSSDRGISSVDPLTAKTRYLNQFFESERCLYTISIYSQLLQKVDRHMRRA